MTFSRGSEGPEVDYDGLLGLVLLGGTEGSNRLSSAGESVLDREYRDRGGRGISFSWAMLRASPTRSTLNFVNNFANLSVELLDETTALAVAALDEDKRAEVDETIEMLTGNLEKIVEHGRRADGIVKSMLEHSRGGERRSVDLNGLIEEALNLAYHGARAQDQSFNITLERDFGRGITPIGLVPQDVARVCLNLFGNGFYAATKRRRSNESGFQSVLKVTTRDLGDAVEIRVRDNGTGIVAEIKDKLFQPFFTTKPTGEGTGLGLSISYDIVTQKHGGANTVDSKVGEFTEFTSAAA